MLSNEKWDTNLKEQLKPMVPWRQALLKGANYLEKYGWCRGSLKNGDRVCVIGAIQFSTNDEEVCTYATMYLSEFLGGIYPAKWNDAPGRTKEEVIAAMRTAAISYNCL